MVSDGDVGDPLDFEAELEAQLEGLGDFKPEQLEEATLADEAKEEKLEPGQASAGREAPALQEVNEVKEMCSAAMESEDLLPDEYRLQLESPHKDLIDMVMSSHAWWRAGLRSLVRGTRPRRGATNREENLGEAGDGRSPFFCTAAISASVRFERVRQEAVERPLKSFSDHLKPALARRIHVGTMDLMGSSHEAYRRTFEFIELTNTWNDLDVPTRAISKTYRQLECGYRDPSMYKALSGWGVPGALARQAHYQQSHSQVEHARAAFRTLCCSRCARDWQLAKHTELRCEEKVSKVSKMVAASWKNRREVSCVATHILRLQQVQDLWWLQGC
eukprot:g9662.t1